jgi:hypothetical protein
MPGSTALRRAPFYAGLWIGSSPFGVMFTTVSNLLAMPLPSAAASLYGCGAQTSTAA